MFCHRDGVISVTDDELGGGGGVRSSRLLRLGGGRLFLFSVFGAACKVLQ